MTLHCRHLVSSTSIMRLQVEFLNSEIADLDAKASKLHELGMAKELKSIPSQKQVCIWAFGSDYTLTFVDCAEACFIYG